MYVVKRSEHNPILGPNSEHSFEAFSAFNGSPVKVGKEIFLLYRAQSLPERFENNQFSLSTIGKAESKDGIHFKKREQFIVPEESWEKFGLEDPRVTKIDGKYFIFYTALSVYPFRAEGIKIGLAISPDLQKISEKHLVTPFNAKAMALFPEKINGKYVAVLTINTDNPPASIALALFEKIEEIWSEKYWTEWKKNLDKHIIDIPKHSDAHLEVGAVPLKTKDGWLLVYGAVDNYMTDHKIFGIQAALLDLKNPQKVIGKSRAPLLTPQEQYEKFGTVSNVIFPSGALIENDFLNVYYGATDTTVAVAKLPLSPLILAMKLPYAEIGFKRLTDGPLLLPEKDSSWQSKAVFNPAAIELDGKISILYRAMSEDNTSTIGLAETLNGTDIVYRSSEPIYLPRESFEQKRVPGGNSGCEDPRLTKIGDTIYMYYTAYNGITPPAVAETHISEEDFKKRNWNWSKAVQVTTDGVDDKDACLLTEKIGGKYFLFHRVNNYICGDWGLTPQFTERNNFRNIPILLPRPGMWDSKKVGISVPPIKTKIGWLLLYHGLSDSNRYRVGAALLSLKDPTIVLSRLTDAVFEPKDQHDIFGQVGNVVFPCGAVVRGDTIYMYYGGADSVVDVAAMSMTELLKALCPAN